MKPASSSAAQAIVGRSIRSLVTDWRTFQEQQPYRGISMFSLAEQPATCGVGPRRQATLLRCRERRSPRLCFCMGEKGETTCLALTICGREPGDAASCCGSRSDQRFKSSSANGPRISRKRPRRWRAAGTASAPPPSNRTAWGMAGTRSLTPLGCLGPTSPRSVRGSPRPFS
jgi:hypothetical protein